jgi:hypothetical protein
MLSHTPWVPQFQFKRKRKKNIPIFLIDQLIKYKWLTLDSEVALRLTEILLLVIWDWISPKISSFLLVLAVVSAWNSEIILFLDIIESISMTTSYLLVHCKFVCIKDGQWIFSLNFKDQVLLVGSPQCVRKWGNFLKNTMKNISTIRTLLWHHILVDMLFA